MTTPSPKAPTMEKSAKHTPGPWIIFADQGSAVAVLPAMRPGEVCSFEGSGLPNKEANARLIAAAPDLYEAARALVEAEDALLAELRAAGEMPDLTEKPWSLVDALRTAIAKAEGRATSPAGLREGGDRG